MITYSQDYFVIQHKITKELWYDNKWITPKDRLDVYGCSLDPDNLEEDYAETLVNIPDHPDDYELNNITIETRINI